MTIQIQPVAWDILPREQQALTVATLPFPGSLREHFMQLELERTGRRDVTFPIASLNATITAICSQLMIRPGQAYDRGGDGPPEPWLVARTKIPEPIIALIMQAWCAHTFAECPGVRAVHERIRPDLLTWGTTQLHF